MIRCALVLALLTVVPNAHASTPRDEAVELIQEIVGVCEYGGMLACENQIRGVPELFEYVRLFDQIEELDAEFDRFLQSNYEKDFVDFDVLQASLSLDLKIKISTAQFVDRMSAVQRVDDGYDVEVDGSQMLLIRRDATGWYLVFPSELRKQFEQLRPYFLAGQLKRAILTYRLLEADMVGLSNDQLESRVSEDIAPVMLAVFPKEKFPSLMQWLVKDVDDVVGFYTRFTNVDEMRAHIASTHDLPNSD